MGLSTESEVEPDLQVSHWQYFMESNIYSAVAPLVGRSKHPLHGRSEVLAATQKDTTQEPGWQGGPCPWAPQSSLLPCTLALTQGDSLLHERLLKVLSSEKNFHPNH